MSLSIFKNYAFVVFTIFLAVSLESAAHKSWSKETAFLSLNGEVLSKEMAFPRKQQRGIAAIAPPLEVTIVSPEKAQEILELLQQSLKEVLDKYKKAQETNPKLPNINADWLGYFERKIGIINWKMKENLFIPLDSEIEELRLFVESFTKNLNEKLSTPSR